MKFFIGITTYQRKEYVGELITSIVAHSNPRHEYHIAVNDDGSTDGTREYLKSLSLPTNFTLRILYSNRKQVHHADNNLILYANSMDYDFGFMMDDDLLIVKRGWEDLYHNTYVKTGFPHLVHHSREWSNPQRITPSTCQGAFWTFTKEALENIGFMDERAFGRRGWGHGDFTARACRIGYNREHGLLDAENSGQYVKLRVKDYVFTPGYDEELQLAMQNADFKRAQITNPSRRYVPLSKSVINHFFDHVYVLNLKRRPDRLQRMTRILAEARVTDYEVWDAIDGNQMANSTTLKNGANGCALSHISIYEDIKAKGYQRALILEDDIIFINDLHKSLLSLYSVPNDWGFLYLGASDYNHVNCEVRTPFYRGGRIDGTFAYAVNGDIIDEVIWAAKSNQNIPIDTRLHSVQHRHKAYIVHPMTCIAQLSGSDIRPDRDTERHAKLINWDLKLYAK